MEYTLLPVIIVLALLIVLVKRLGDVSGSIEYIKQSLSLLERDLRQLKEQLKSPPLPPAATPQIPVPPPVAPTPVVEVAVPPIVAPIFQEEEKAEIPAVLAPQSDVMAAFTVAPPITVPSEAPAIDPVVAGPIKTPPPPPVISEPQASWWQQWLSRNPDLEKFIGENLINKIGIAILVLGIAFFVKYAIDQDWINEIGRVSIGLLCGGILVGLAHRLRLNYRPFSSVLAGGGITVLYFTIAFAFHQYHLFSQSVAFVIMVVITAFAIALSVLYDRLELGILATLGGFVTPFLVSRGDGNYIALFTYLAILNAGLIALAYYKKWRVLNFIAFFFTVIIYSGWIIQRVHTPAFSYMGTFLFGTVFYVMFIVMNLLYHVVRSGKLKVFDGCILFSINLAYYGAGYYLLTEQHLNIYAGLFTAALGAFNLIFSYTLFKRKTIDRNFIYLLIGLTLSFISLAGPVQLSGHYITLFWASEMVVLYWLYQKSGITLVKIASVIITVLTGISLLLDWLHFTGNAGVSMVLFNKCTITSVYTGAALLLMSCLLASAKEEFFLAELRTGDVKKIYIVNGIAVLFIGGLLEVWMQFTSRFPQTGLHYIYVELYCLLFATTVYFVLRMRGVKSRIRLYLISVAILAFVYLVNSGNVYDIERSMLTSGHNRGHFAAHWIAIGVLVLMIINTIKLVRVAELPARMLQFFACVCAVFCIIMLSVEIQHCYVWLSYREPASILRAASVFDKAGLSILWGLSSFALIWLGMRAGFKPLRILALVLFGVTILKLFFFDLRNISQGGKIAAFILLGAILLTVSFMYQRLKKIIIDDQPAPKDEA